MKTKKELTPKQAEEFLTPGGGRPKDEQGSPDLKWFKSKGSGKGWYLYVGIVLVLMITASFIIDPWGTYEGYQRNSMLPCDELTAGDKVVFEKAVFTGTYPDGKFSHLQEIEGVIIQKSYWAEKNLIMLTIKDDSGRKYRISDMNIYRNGCRRELWDDEKKRSELLERETYRLKLNEPIVNQR